jgi:hypothetical protein
MRNRLRLMGAVVPVGFVGPALAFDAPVTLDPTTSGVTATFNSTPGKQSISRVLRLDLNNPFVTYPDVYYVKYHSDGNSIVKFDTLGSDFGSRGPIGQIPDAFRGAYDNSQIAVYRADGSKVAISKTTVGLDGNPIVSYPRTASSETQWYVGEGLSEVYFYPNAPTSNPHWSASPSDPNYYAGWSAPGNPGNSQKYYQPYYPTNLNEYHVWSTALSTTMLDNNGQTVFYPGTTDPRPQPGWRYSDYTRVGPASTWNRYAALPAGDYYIAFSDGGLTHEGDTYSIQYLQAPVHYDYDTQQINQSALGPSGLGTWQYYLDTHGEASYGTIQFNITQISSTLINSSWKSNAGGAWAGSGNWSGPVPDGIEQYANFGTFNGTITTPQNVNLTSPITVGSIAFDNANSYTLSGASITLDVLISDRASINVLNGSHTISAPLVLNKDVNLNVAPAASLLDLTGPITSPLKLIEKQGAGAAQVQAINAYALNVTGGKFKISAKGAPNSLTGASLVRQLVISGAGSQLDLTNNAFVVDYNAQNGAPPSPIGDIRGYLKDSQLITSSTVGGNSVGYVANADLHLASYAGFSFPAGDYSQVLFKFTYGGDANLDSVVNALDFNALASNYGLSSNSFWRQGDFSYDGVVNTMDFTMLAANFNRGTFSPLGSSPALGAFVPEPAMLSLLIASAAFAHRFRRAGRNIRPTPEN